VDTYHWLITLHITAAFLFVGGSVAAGVLNTLAVRAERPSETAALLRLVRRTLPIIFVGVGGTLVFGLWLWHQAHYGIGTAWLWISLVLWALANALGGIGGRHQEHAREKAEELAAAGDVSNDELKRILADRKGNAVSWAAGIATLAILALMIGKP
jgi:uncharacterized membrane protein